MIFDTGPLFGELENTTEKVIILQGGTSSGKTYTSIQWLFYKAITERNIIITVTGESIPNLKKGAYRDAKIILFQSEYLQKHLASHNQTDRIFEFKNGSIIEFNSNIDEQAAKAGKRDYLFVDEANGITYGIFWQLARRTRQTVIVAYNPSAPFWCHEKLIGTTAEGNDLHATVRLIISDHRHNPFLSEEEHESIEGIKDKELWRVYARGMTGNVTGLVYPNWTRIPDKDFPETGEHWGGLDFGYTNDPTAGVKIVKQGESLFFKELCYEPGIDPRLLKTIFFSHGFTENHMIYCDHDPDQIIMLRNQGLLAMKSRKGPGSLKAGIMTVNNYKCYYTESSKNIHEERIRYMYEVDKITGLSTNEPVGTHDHCMAAIRMGVYTKLYRQ
jgi:phage terminase large subunit